MAQCLFSECSKRARMYNTLKTPSKELMHRHSNHVYFYSLCWDPWKLLLLQNGRFSSILRFLMASKMRTRSQNTLQIVRFKIYWATLGSNLNQIQFQEKFGVPSDHNGSSVFQIWAMCYISIKYYVKNVFLENFPFSQRKHFK